MEDLDLDELDKQVNKMMTRPRNKRLTSSRAPQAIVRPVSSVAPQADVTPDSVINDSVINEPASTPAPQADHARPLPTIPVRSRMHPGVMDIVQTAPVKSSAPPSSRPTHTGVSVAPPQANNEPAVTPKNLESPQEVTNKVMAALSMDDIRPPQRPVRPVSAPIEQSAPVADAPQETEAEKPKSKWPDPLDFLDYDRPKPKEPAPQLAKEPTEEPQPAPTMPEPTPFVTTKVEKRPLGAYADMTQEQPAQEPDALARPEAPIAPPETNKSEMAAVSLQSQQHVQDAPQPQDLQSMTIPQQYYAEQPEPTDQVRSMYDTKEYHAPPQPMYHSRKGSPWFVIGVVALITFIVVLVLVGYFMATGTFNITFGNISALA